MSTSKTGGAGAKTGGEGAKTGGAGAKTGGDGTKTGGEGAKTGGTDTETGEAIVRAGKTSSRGVGHCEEPRTGLRSLMSTPLKDWQTPRETRPGGSRETLVSRGTRLELSCSEPKSWTMFMSRLKMSCVMFLTSDTSS